MTSELLGVYSMLFKISACNLCTLLHWEQGNMYNGKSRNMHNEHNIFGYLLFNMIICIDYLKSEK
jgi:hypothetical protein